MSSCYLRVRFMTSIADIEIPADGTGTGELFESVPSLTCEMERVIASSGHGLWLSGPSQSEVEDALDGGGDRKLLPDQ